MRNLKLLLPVSLGCLALSATSQETQFGTASDDSLADVICFAEGTPEEYVQLRNSILPQVLGFNLANRWSGGQGTPRTVTWSFVPDGVNIPNGVGEGSAPSNLFAMLDNDYASQGGRAAWINRVQQSFDRWEELSGLTFQRRTFGGQEWDDGASWNSQGNANRGDIRIGGKPIDGTNGILAYASFPSNGNMVFDIAENWGSSSNQNRFWRNTVMHEMGHALGISHVCSSNGRYLMEPFLQTTIDGPYHDDIRAIQRHYGDPNENDNSAGNATNLGVLPAFLDLGNISLPPAGVAPPNSSTLSLDASNESDWFRFDLTGDTTLTVTVTPLGVSYDDSDQQGNGSCPSSTNFIDSSAIGNPEIYLYGASGSNQLGSAATGTDGEVEELVITLPAGTYYVEVFNNDVSGIQLYDLTFEADDGPPMCASSASVFNRNGGANLNTYVANAPQLGGTVNFTVTGDYNFGSLFAYNAPAAITLGNGQVLLTDVSGNFLFSKNINGLPSGSASQSVPMNLSFCGVTAYTQVLLTGPTAGGPSIQLTNAQDLTVGN